MITGKDRGDGWDPEVPRPTDLDHMAPAPGVGVVTSAQARGVVGYGAIGLVAGLLVGALIALVPIDDWSYWGRLALFGGVSAFGGLVAGAVFGGGYEPETEGDVDIVDLRDGRQMRRRPPAERSGTGGSRHETADGPTASGDLASDAHPSRPPRGT